MSESTPQKGVLGWTLTQFGHLIEGAYLTAGGGVVRALWRRELGGVAMAQAFALLCGVAGVLAAVVHRANLQHATVSVGMVWAYTLGGGVAAGAVVAARTHRMGLWELYGVMVVTWGAAYLALGWPLAAFSQAPLAWQPVPRLGPKILGPLWDHVLLLWGPLMLVAAILGASFTLLFSGLGQGRGSRLREQGIGLEWRLACRHMAGRHHGTLSTTAVVTFLGVALGVASLITVTAVMSGYQEDIQSKILSTNAHLVVQKYGIDFTDHARISHVGMQVPGVAAAAPFAFNEAMLSVNGRGLGILLKGIDPALAANVSDTARHLCVPPEPAATWDLKTCTWANDAGPALLNAWLTQTAGPPPVVVGLSLFRRLGIPLGSQVYLMTPVGMAGARGGAPRRLPFRVVGVFASGMHEFDAHLVYTPLPAAQRLLGLGHAVSGVEFRLHDANAVSEVGEKVLSAIGRYPYRTLDWRQLNASIFMALTLQKVVMFLVLAFIVVVAAFNIASTLFMAVVEKAEHIAVLSSMGATHATIMKIFVLEGWITGIVGTLAGTLLACGATFLLGHLHVAIAADVYMVDALTVRLDPGEVALTVAAALVICHLATLYPALRAARGRPIDVLRHG